MFFLSHLLNVYCLHDYGFGKMNRMELHRIESERFWVVEYYQLFYFRIRS